MNLFEINAGIIEALEQSIDLETGEVINEDMLAKMEELQIAFDQKVENVACYIKNLEADAAALKAEKDAFATREKQTKNKIENLKKYLTKALGGEKFESTRCKISFRASESVNVTDITKIENQFLKYKDPEVDKTAIKKALKSGAIIDGVELVTNNNIQIK